MQKTITEISAQKRDNKRCNIYLDGEFYSGMQLITVMRNRLKVGLKISEEELNRITLESEREVAMEKALQYVSKSMHTEKEVRKYLLGKGFLPEAVSEVIAKLIGYGYINDAAYATAFFKGRKNVKGKRLTAYELKIKGVDENVIEEAKKQAPDEDDGAYYTAQKFLKNKTLDYETIAKCYRRLLSKGFDYDVAKSVVERIKRENEYCED